MPKSQIQIIAKIFYDNKVMTRMAIGMLRHACNENTKTKFAFIPDGPLIDILKYF